MTPPEPSQETIRPTDEEAVRLARTLMRTARFGALAAIEPQSGDPLASRVAVATDIDGAPLILVSALSGHTAAIAADPRCSLLLGEPGKGDPLAWPRISISCAAARLQSGSPARQRAERRFLSRHPKAKLYAGFADFSYFRLDPLKAGLNGGFGKAYELSRADLLVDLAVNDALAAGEAAAVSHMNADHADAVEIYARAYAGAEPGKWRLTGIDAEGMDLICGDDTRRVYFPKQLLGAAEIRTALVDMAREGRKKLGQ